MFGATGTSGAVPVIIIPGRNACKPYITVPDGMYAIVQSNGADVMFGSTNNKVYPPGFHWAYPWMKVEYLVTKQTLVFDTPVKGCKTKDDVNVIIDVSIMVRIMGDAAKGEDPNLVTDFIYKLGATELSMIFLSLKPFTPCD